jgi:hypothetical protein
MRKTDAALLDEILGATTSRGRSPVSDAEHEIVSSAE